MFRKPTSDMNIKTTLKITVLTFLVIATASWCYALQLIEEVSTEPVAQELGVKIRSEIVGTNTLTVWLEFLPHGKLEHFRHGELEISSGGRWLVRATLLPLQQTRDRVVLCFSADADYVKMSTVTVIVHGASRPDPDGYKFVIKDFVKMPPNAAEKPAPVTP